MKTLVSLLLSGSIMLMLASCGGDSDSKKEDYADRMAEEHQGDAPISNDSKTYKQLQPVDSSSVDYAQLNHQAVSGYYAQPKDAGEKMPGIIVIHEWWGLNDNIRMMSRRLAGHGYKALAVDLYNGKTADSPDEAHKLMNQAMKQKEENIDNLKQAYAYLHDEKEATNIGVIGWCFGGGWSLQTALALPHQIDAAVIYYGQLVTDKNKLKPLSMPLMGFFGGKDESISASTIKTFKQNLNDLGKSVEVYRYPDAHHAFANPSGKSYDKKAAQDAWKKTIHFLDKNLKE